MNLNNISAWSIRNPVVPIVLFVALLLAGAYSFKKMDVVNNPEIEFPGVIVSITQPGAAPSEIENQITQKVESAVRSINGVQTIRSTASEGNSTTFVEFDLGTDVIEAVSDVTNAVDGVRGSLPQGILEPRIFKAEISGGFLGIFAVEANDMTIEQLSWFIDDTVAKSLLSVNGMAEVDRFGGVSREIEVTLIPSRMQALGVTASQINGALRQTNIDAAGGIAEIGGTRQSVRVLGNDESAFQLSQRKINLGAGRSVRLADVADVRDGYSERSSISKVRDKEVVNFSMSRARGASDVTTFTEAKAKIAEIEEANPGVHFVPLFNTVQYTESQYDSSISAMIEGAVLAVVVVFFFLRDWRATIISAIAIPLSAIPTFFIMDLMGFNLNFLSLLALGLVAGVLVDDAIVEIENIVRHMRMGKSAYQASIDAADEIGMAVVATSFCIVAVFLPVGLMPGISGQFFRNFGITVVIAVLMSLAVARMITPMMAAYFLQAKGHSSHGEGPWMDRYMKVLHWSLDRSKMLAARAKLNAPQHSSFSSFFRMFLSILSFIVLLGVPAAVAMKSNNYIMEMDWPAQLAAKVSDQPDTILALLITRPLGLLIMLSSLAIGAAAGYLTFLLICKLGAGLSWMFRDGQAYWSKHFASRFLDQRMWMMALGYFSFIATIMLFGQTPFQFQPAVDDDNARVEIEMVPGTSLESTEIVADRVAAMLYEQQEVEIALERVREGNATIYITLRDDRERTSIEFQRELAPVLANIPDARARFQADQGPGPPGSGRDISLMLAGSDPELLEETATKVVDEMKGLKTIVAPRVNADMNRPEIIIRPRADLAAELGVTTIALSQTIRIATLGEIEQNTAKFSLADRQVPIVVKLPKESRGKIDTLANLPVPTATGGTVPLGRVADISFGAGPTAIERYNQNRRVIIGADLGNGVLRGNAMEQINALPTLNNLPQGVIRDVIGSDDLEQELVENFSAALVSGVILVFGVLVLLYKRIMSPTVNMCSLALAPLGGIFLVWLVGQPLSMPVLIGTLMLLGIVSKNSILLIDFAIEEMDKGTRRLTAIVEAGHKRAQPIVMTTVAMTAGMIPTAISLSGDGAWRAPMGTTVIGGLLLSTLLTLLIVPAGFSLADGLERRVGPWMRRNFLTIKPGDKGEDEPDAPANDTGQSGFDTSGIAGDLSASGAAPAKS